MAEQIGESHPDVAAQVRRHLESLRAAGVEWLPAHVPWPVTPAEVPATDAAPKPLFDVEPAPAVPAGAGACRAPAAGADGAGGAGKRLRALQGAGLDADADGLRRRPARPGIVLHRRGAGGRRGRAGRAVRRRGRPAAQPHHRGLRHEARRKCTSATSSRCRPPGNRRRCRTRPPTAGNTWRRAGPGAAEVHLRLGASAAKNLLGTSRGITRCAASSSTIAASPVLCTFHPSFLLRDPRRRRRCGRT